MTLELCRSVDEFRLACERVRQRGATLGLVPTMGALHRGHLALMQEAARQASVVAVTIFVNPTQFGPGEDFGSYPRDLAGDLEQCRSVGVELVFAPAESDMYLGGDATRVRVSRLTDHLCGTARPGHFDGVTTIVAKLFAVAGACAAVFGRKDYQQLKVIERMKRDLMLPVRIVSHPTVRETDGLALSSRNVYLDGDERPRARAIPRALSRAVQAFAAGERSCRALREPVAETLTTAGFRPDYVTIADADELRPWADDATLPERALLAVAAFMGTTRLIDNVVLGEDPPPNAEA
jgi:pantoate--beta-alanine ligase